MLMLCMPLATFAQKFGHVNAQDIMQSMPEFIKARGEVEAAAKQYDNDLKAMQDELQRKAQDYDKNASTMNETKKKETEESLQQMYQKIQQTAQDNQQALAKLQQEKISPITNKLVEAIKAVGKAGGYVYIMHIRHTLHQRHSEQGCYCRGEGTAQQAGRCQEVIDTISKYNTKGGYGL